MDSLPVDLLVAIVKRVSTRTHASTSNAFLQAQLRRRKGRLIVFASPQYTTRLPWFLWSDDGGSPQLHLLLSGDPLVSLPADLVASKCVVRSLSASAKNPSLS